LRERLPLKLHAEAERDPIYIVEIRDDVDRVMQSAVRQSELAKAGQVRPRICRRRLCEREGEIDERARTRIKQRLPGISAEGGGQTIIVRKAADRRAVVRDSIVTVVRDGDGHGHHFPLEPGQLRLAEHQFGVQPQMRYHHFRMDAVNAEDVRDDAAFSGG